MPIIDSAFAKHFSQDMKDAKQRLIDYPKTIMRNHETKI
jgi:hypothetical protein